MVKDYELKDLTINGKYSKYFWDSAINPNASIVNGLSNCTTLCYGLALLKGLGAPVKQIRDAKNWHKNISDDWEVLDYSRDILREGDIVEWSENHVAIMEDKNTVSASWYTGINGKSTIDGHYDTREGINSLQELSDMMSTSWPYRFYHRVSIEQECKGVGGGNPKYILRKKDNSDIDEKLDEIIELIREIQEVI